MFRPLRKTILASQPRPYLRHHIGSYRNYTFGNVVRQHSVFKPLVHLEENIRTIEKEIGAPSKPFVELRVVEPFEKKEQKGGAKTSKKPSKNNTTSTKTTTDIDSFKEKELQNLAEDAFNHPIKV